MCGGGGGGVDEQESRAALSEQAAFQLKRYGSTFVPLENMAIDDALNMGSDANYQAAMNRGASQAGAVYEGRIGDASNQVLSRGYDPSSGGFQAKQGALYDAYQRGRGESVSDAALTNTDREYQALGNVVAMGQGLSNDALKGMIDVASTRSSRLTDQAISEFEKSAAIQQGIGGIAGYGTGVAMNQGRRSGDRYG